MKKLVEFPKCVSCGTIDDVYECKVCLQFACTDCSRFVSDFDIEACVHEAYEEEPNLWQEIELDDLHLDLKHKED